MSMYIHAKQGGHISMPGSAFSFEVAMAKTNGWKPSPTLKTVLQDDGGGSQWEETYWVISEADALAMADCLERPVEVEDAADGWGPKREGRVNLAARSDPAGAGGKESFIEFLRRCGGFSIEYDL